MINDHPQRRYHTGHCYSSTGVTGDWEQIQWLYQVITTESILIGVKI